MKKFKTSQNTDETETEVITETAQAENSADSGDLSNVRGADNDEVPEAVTSEPTTPAESINKSQEILNSVKEFIEVPKKRGRRSKRASEPEPEPAIKAPLIPGTLAVEILDTVTTSASAAADAWLTKKGKRSLPPEAFAMSKEQKTTLAPLAEKALEEMKLSDNPVEVFFGTWGLLALSNFMLAKQLQKANEQIITE